MFSVALSVGSHRPGVTWRPALRSPDFPLPGWDGANQRRPLGLTAIARLTPATTLPQKPGFAPVVWVQASLRDEAFCRLRANL